MTKTGAKAAGALVLALAVGGAAHAANLVSDSNFNSPYGGPVFTTYSAGSSFGAWNVTSGSVDLVGGYWQAPTPAGGSVDLDGLAPGAISQTIATGTGQYTLTFDLSGNPDGLPTTKTLAVLVGNAVKTFTYTIGANSHGAMMYVPESLTFHASGPTTLVFSSLDNAGSPYGPVVGDVSIGAVPEPASWALMFLGIGVMGGALRSGRSRAAGLVRT